MVTAALLRTLDSTRIFVVSAPLTACRKKAYSCKEGTMRSYLVLISLLFVAASTSNTLAQTTTTNGTSKPGPLSFSEVIAVNDASANELYTRAKLWFLTAFVDSKNVLEVQDKEAGILAGKGSFPYEPNILMSSSLIRGHVTFSVSIIFKDGRYKYSFSDFIHQGSSLRTGGPISFDLITTTEVCPPIPGTSKGMREKVWKHLKKVSTAKANALTQSLKSKLAQPIDGKDSF
jgi:hypothetical protein